MKVQPVKGIRLFEEITQQIATQIQSGELKVGDKLPNERELAEEFGVSRHAVREALRSLGSIGLLEFKRGALGGAFVARSSSVPLENIMRSMVEAGGVTLEQLTQARMVIETAVVGVVCELADDESLKSLAELAAQAERAARLGNEEARTRLSLEFHTGLAERTGNPILVMMMKSLMSIVAELVATVGSIRDEDLLASRNRLMSHLIARDASAATAEMQWHLRKLHEHYRQSLDGSPDDK